MGNKSRPWRHDVRCPRGEPGLAEVKERLARGAGSLQGEEPFGSECHMERLDYGLWDAEELAEA